MATTPTTTPTGCSYYYDPVTGKACCSFCGSAMVSKSEKPRAQGFAREIIIWCENGSCSSKNMTGQLVHFNVPSTRHRQKSAT